MIETTSNLPQEGPITTKAPSSVFTCVTTRNLDHLRGGTAVELNKKTMLMDAVVTKSAAAPPPPSLSIPQRRLAVLSLLDEAARRDVARFQSDSKKFAAIAGGTPLSSTPRVQWWAAMRKQIEAHLPADAADLEARLHVAFENLSSMGIWFETPSLRLPDRSYTALTPYHVPPQQQPASQQPPLIMLPDGQLYQWSYLVGLCSFSYSTYVSESRRASQTQILNALATPAEISNLI